VSCNPKTCATRASDGSGQNGSPDLGPFNPDLPLTLRPTAVRSEPMSGAAEAQAAAALMTTGKSIGERSAAVVAAGGALPVVDRPVAADSAGARRLRERRASGTGVSTESSAKNILAEIAAAAAARRKASSGDATTEPS